MVPIMYPATNTTKPPPAINPITLGQSGSPNVCDQNVELVRSSHAPHKIEATNRAGATRSLILRISSIYRAPSGGYLPIGFPAPISGKISVLKNARNAYFIGAG